MKLGGWLVMLTAMIMFLSFLGLSTGLNPVLNSVGINITSDTSQLVSSDMENSSFWKFIFGSGTGLLIIIAISSVITIGLYVKTGDTNILILPLVVYIAGLYISTFWAVMDMVIKLNQPWMSSIIGLIFSALAIGFVFACVDYFVGR